MRLGILRKLYVILLTMANLVAPEKLGGSSLSAEIKIDSGFNSILCILFSASFLGHAHRPPNEYRPH